MAGRVCLTRRNWNRKLRLRIQRTFRRQLARPSAQLAVQQRLVPGRPRLGAQPGSRQFRPAHEAPRRVQALGRQQLLRLLRRRQCSEANQHPLDGYVPAQRQHLRERQRVFRLRQLESADRHPLDGRGSNERLRRLQDQPRDRPNRSSASDPARELQSLARQAAPSDQQAVEQHAGCGLPRHQQNTADRQLRGSAKAQLRAVVPGMFHRVGLEDLNARD